jgi:hypothetical protein
MQYYSLQGSKRCHLLIIDIKTRRNMNIRREVQPDISLCRLLRCRCLRLRLGGATIDVMVVMVIVMEIGVMDYGLWIMVFSSCVCQFPACVLLQDVWR